MTGGFLKFSVILSWGVIGILTTSISANAQESASILGFWKQRIDSVYIEVTEIDGVINAEIVRNDWAPGLVGKIVFQELTSGKKNKWTGQAYIIGSDKMGVVSVSLKGNEELTTKVKPGRTKKIKWLRTDAIEKRYQANFIMLA